jgi:hypothetical protein
MLACALALGVAAVGCGNEDQVRAANPASFVQILRSSNLDFEPQGSPTALAKKAALTVVGTIEDVAEGRAFATTETSGPIFLTIVLTIRVDQVLGGDETAVKDGLIYVELDRIEAQTADDYRATIPKDQRAVLFLDERTNVNQGGPVTPAKGIPDGARIFAPYAEGVVLQDDSNGGVVGGFEDLNELGADWVGADSVDVFASRIAPAPGTESPTEPTDTTLG